MSQEAHFQDLLDQMLDLIELVTGDEGERQVQVGDDLAAFIEANPDFITGGGIAIFKKRREEAVEEFSRHKLDALGQMLLIFVDHGVSGFRRALAGLDPNPIPEDSQAMWDYARTTLRMARSLPESIDKSVLIEFACRTIFQIGNEMGESGEPFKHEVSEDYYIALKHVFSHSLDENLATELTELGIYFDTKYRGVRSDNIAQAIVCYETALKVFTIETHPNEWAKTQINLGTAYRNCILGDRGFNLEKAIACFRSALKVFTYETHRDFWAHTQTNLGLVYRDRVKGDGLKNKEQAIACHRAALKVFTYETRSYDWATVQNNLGLSYTDRLKGNLSDNIELSIACYEKALKVCKYETYLHEWTKTQMNLGNAYLRRVQGDPSENKEQAIAFYENALKELKNKIKPNEWANTCFSLGNAYTRRSKGDLLDNIEQAIAYFENALRVFTFETHPDMWAQTQNSLALACCVLFKGDRSEHWARAIACYENGLPILKKTQPDTTIKGYGNLGDLYIVQGEYAKARIAYLSALHLKSTLILEHSLEETISVASQNAAGIGAKLAHVCALLGDVSGSVEALEQSRAAGLLNAMRFDAVWLAELDDEVRHQVETVRAQIAGLRQEPFPEGVDTSLAMLEREKELEALQAELQSVMDEAEYQPPNGADVEDVIALAPNGGAVLQLAAIDELGAVVTLLPSGVSADDLSDQHVLLLPEFDRDTFIDLTNAWFEEYAHMISHDPLPEIVLRRANVKLEELLAYLWEHMFAPICERLDELGIEAGSELVLMPQGLLALLPLHAAGIKAEACLLDRYVVRYAPSGFALKTAQQRLANVTETQNLFGVINPTADLKQSEEVEWPALQNHISDTTGLVQSEADLDAVISSIDGQYYVHFAGHGGFDWQNPKDSGLKLANDTVLNVLDIQKQLKLSGTRLVFLSACEAGMVDVNNQPDEYVGLPAAFMQAGAPGVAATFWSVLDIPTAHLVDAFYGRHLKGADPAYALREVVLSLKAGELVDIEKEMKRLAEESKEHSENQASSRVGMGGNSGQGGARSVEDGTDTRPLATLPIIWAAYGYNGV